MGRFHMGKIKYILIGFLALIMVSCDGLFGVENNVGKPVVFGISQQNPKTRTAYSLNVDGQIEWRENDMVAIYMDWDDGNGYAGIPREKGIYKVSPGSKLHSEGKDYRYGRISYLSDDKLTWKGDFRENDGRAHEYPHTFWSVYPSNTPFANGKFEFSLPSNQDNINDVNGLGLAAYRKGVYSNTTSEGHVELLYSPMFTTFDVTINNKSKKNIIGNLKLASENKYICGTYYVRVKDNKFVFDSFDPNYSEDYIEKAIETLLDGKSTELMYFIANTDYSGGDLYFSFEDGVKHPIGENIIGGYKYNIVINVNEKNVEVEVLSDAAAQMLALAIRHWINDQNAIFALLQDLYDVNPPEGKNNWFNNNIWGKFCNLTNDESTFKKLTYKDLVDVFGSKSAVDSLLNYIQQKSYEKKDVTITASPKICTSLKGTDLVSLFPGATNIYLQISQNNVDKNNPIHVDIEGFDNLLSVTIEYAQSVKLKDCLKLATATFRNPSDIFSGAIVENCPVLQ